MHGDFLIIARVIISIFCTENRPYCPTLKKIIICKACDENSKALCQPSGFDPRGFSSKARSVMGPSKTKKRAPLVFSNILPSNWSTFKK